MAAITTNPGTMTFDGPRESEDASVRSFRLDPKLISIVEDLAMGVEVGESGLKSCSASAAAAADAGAKAAEVNARHHHETQLIEDEDECFNAIGDLKYRGFSFGEIAKRVQLAPGATHLLALERWADKVKLRCRDEDEVSNDDGPFWWRGSTLHERRRRGQRAMTALRQTDVGEAHAAVLYIVYGHPDPMLLSARRFMRDLEEAPAGDPPKLDVGDRDVFNLAKCLLLEMGDELAPLARYTAEVEARRQELAHSEAARCLRRIDGVIPLCDHRARVASADRILSSTDALRDGVAMPAPKREDETRLEYDARFDEAKTERMRFISKVKGGANRMLTAASEAFKAAWLAS